MKRILTVVLLAALALTGCSASGREQHPDWDESWVRLADYIGVEPLEGFTLDESSDVLSISGLYYAAWASGGGQEFVNADGEDAVVYDAQIYMLLQECRSAEAAEEAVAAWTALEQDSYGAADIGTKVLGGQEFELLTLMSGREGNPYTHGAAAFAVRDRWAVSVELVCADGFAGDPQLLLEQFLSGFHYNGTT